MRCDSRYEAGKTLYQELKEISQSPAKQENTIIGYELIEMAGDPEGIEKSFLVPGLNFLMTQVGKYDRNL